MKPSHMVLICPKISSSASMDSWSSLVFFRYNFSTEVYKEDSDFFVPAINSMIPIRFGIIQKMARWKYAVSAQAESMLGKLSSPTSTFTKHMKTHCFSCKSYGQDNILFFRSFVFPIANIPNFFSTLFWWQNIVQYL